jgi:D-glycero-D-manno-heptose 1,7-bisphosphate phosphatase
VNKAVYLDRDGTIIKDKGYIKNVRDVEFYAHTFESLKELQKYFLLFIITNQPGIAKGLITANEVEMVNKFMLQQLKDKGVLIHEIYYCPHLKEDHCNCRKPNPYYIHQSAKKYTIDVQSSFVVGDHPSDVQLALNSQAKGIYLLTGHGRKHVRELPGQFHDPVTICRNIKDATRQILNKIT